MSHWFFQKHDGYQDIDQSSSSESFSGGAIRDLATAIVREGIQNALDARERSGPLSPVLVRISLGRCPAPAELHNRKWFEDLIPHAKIPDVGAPNAPDLDTPNDFLLFEDFNTKGLVGDYSAPYKPGEENNFVNFMYHDGLTGKAERKLGSRGVGKIVFTMASRIRTTLAYTIRSDDEARRPLLIGKNLLRFRELSGSLYGGRAYFLKGWPASGARQPIEDEAVLAAFRESFPLTRGSEPGLSLVIPFLDPAVDARNLRYAVVTEYHYAILRGELVVELIDHGSAESFSADRLPCLGDEQVDSEVALARWSVSQELIDLSTQSPEPGKVQRLDGALVGEDVRAAIRSALNRLERVAIRVPLYIHPKASAPVATHFDVFLERADRHSPKPKFIRELLPVSDVRDAKGATKVRGLVLISDAPLAAFLRSAEGANHTDWSPRTDRFQEKYKGRLGEIRFIATAVSSLVEAAFGRSSDPMGGISTRFFSLSIPDAGRLPVGNKRKQKGTDPEFPPPDLEPKPPTLFKVSRTEGGFTISENRSEQLSEARLPKRLRVRVAYDVNSGSPWTQYEAADFKFGKFRGTVRLAAINAKIVYTQQGNRFAIEDIEPGFEITAHGFDANRDLIVDVTATPVAEMSAPEGDDDR